MSELVCSSKKALDGDGSCMLVNLRQAFSGWRELKELEGRKADVDVALLLLQF